MTRLLKTTKIVQLPETDLNYKSVYMFLYLLIAYKILDPDGNPATYYLKVSLKSVTNFYLFYYQINVGKTITTLVAVITQF